MNKEKFLQDLAKEYVQQTGEAYLLENGALTDPTPALDRKMAALRRKRLLWRPRAFLGAAASIIVVVVAWFALFQDNVPTAEPQMWGGHHDAAAPQAAPPIPPAVGGGGSPGFGIVTPPITTSPMALPETELFFRQTTAEVMENLESVRDEAPRELLPAPAPGVAQAYSHMDMPPFEALLQAYQALDENDPMTLAYTFHYMNGVPTLFIGSREHEDEPLTIVAIYTLEDGVPVPLMHGLDWKYFSQ